ncbi:MAG: SlyX family protein [Candidatus Methylumidiphilus sp.]
MDRLIDIETKLAFQEDTLQALNDVVCRQQKQIDQLEAQVRRLAERLKQLAEAQAPASPPLDEKPPHY